MDLRKLIYTSICILAAISCKKEEETIIPPSLDGYLRIHGVPEFIERGQTVNNITATGISHPEGKSLGLSWKVSPSETVYDTTDVFSYTFSDTLQTYTVTCYAFAEGYTGASASTYTTAVAPGYNGSIQGVRYKDIADDSTSVRHMQYYYKKIGEQTWTINNMAVREGIPFRNAEVMSEVFGRYYNYDQAKAACDSLDNSTQNWELPTREDWEILETYIKGLTGKDKTEFGYSPVAALSANVSFNGNKMWEYWPNVGDIINGSGFSIIPAGYSNTIAKTSEGVYEYAAYWTSTEATETEAYYKYIICDQPDIQTSKGKKDSFGASVRCILK